MFNLYFFSTGIPVEHLQTDNKYEIPYIIHDIAKKLESDSDNYILISTEEIPTYQVKGINE